MKPIKFFLKTQDTIKFKKPQAGLKREKALEALFTTDLISGDLAKTHLKIPLTFQLSLNLCWEV